MKTRPIHACLCPDIGQVTLLLDEAEVPLRPFDVVVQRGTNHYWLNQGPEPALLMGVLVDAR